MKKQLMGEIDKNILNGILSKTIKEMFLLQAQRSHGTDLVDDFIRSCKPNVFIGAVINSIQSELQNFLGVSIKDEIKFTKEQDPLLNFFENECVFGGNCYIAEKALWRQYDEWVNRIGLQHKLQTEQFSAQLENRGYKLQEKEILNVDGTVVSEKCWLDITLRDYPQYLEDYYPDDSIPDD